MAAKPAGMGVRVRRDGRAAAAVVLGLGLALLAGCGAARPAAGGPPWVRAALTFAPSPPLALRYETLVLTLTTAGGRPLSGARVRLQPVMDGMGGMSGPVVLAAQAGGRYSGRALFVMGGSWRAQVDVTAGGRTARLDLPFQVGQ